MSEITFEWDENKNQSNIHKHGVSFAEAETVFSDSYARLIFDPDHSENEERFILLGVSEALKTLVVCHCYLEDDSVVRIISARKATKREQSLYKEHLL